MPTMRTPPTLSDVAAANLKATRDRRDLSTRALSARLDEQGVALSPGAVLRLESDDPEKRRRLDVDDLGALALALDTSPWFLLSPRTSEPVAITPHYSGSGDAVSRWLRGRATLSRVEVDDQEADAATRRQVEDAPPWARADYGRPDDRLWAIGALRSAVEREVNGATGPHTPAQRAAMLRRELEQVRSAVELMADRLDGEDGA